LVPRSRFHSADGERDYDREGCELPDDEAAQIEAVRYAGEVLRWNAAALWARGQWRVEVTDDAGTLLFTVITLAVDAPRPPDGEPAQPAND
jgi:hypothetical protein